MQKRVLRLLTRVLEYALLIFIVPSALILKVYRMGGGTYFPATTRVLKMLGVMPVINHYYEPFYDSTKFTTVANTPRPLPGIDFNVSSQIEFLRGLIFSGELLDLNLTAAPRSVSDFHLDNGRFVRGDAEFLYQFIRATKPGKIVEIGSGYSTKIARLAHIRNRKETAAPTNHICIEPFEMDWLEKLDDVTVIRSRVETLAYDWSNELKDGDLLFIDSSHIIRPHGDVLKEYLDILPRLSKGVYIHVHDIFSPRDYLETWQKHMNFWNEQYLLEAVLSNTARYEIIASLNLLKHDHFQALQQVCPYLTINDEPGSIYIRVR
jgi:Methyltransferase domain